MKTTVLRLSLTIALTLAATQPVQAAVDEEAAKALARQENCLKCHGVDKKKDGPSFKEVAAKFKGKAGAEERLIKHITTGEKAKFEDGHEEDHKIIKEKDQAKVKSLIQWVLSL